MGLFDIFTPRLVKKARAYLQTKEYETQTVELTTGCIAVEGLRQRLGVAEKALIIVITKKMDAVNRSHLTHFAKLGQKRGVDEVYIVTNRELPEEVVKTIANSHLTLLQPADLDDPEEPEPATPEESEAYSTADTPDRDKLPGSRNKRLEYLQRTKATPDDSSGLLTRRRLLASGGVVALGAGAYTFVGQDTLPIVGSDDSSEDIPPETREELLDTIMAYEVAKLLGNAESANDQLHPDAERPELREDEIDELAADAFESKLTDEIVDWSEDEATVRVTGVTGDGTEERVFELRTDGDEWLLWDSDL